MILIVGLGPGGRNDISSAALNSLQSARKVILRTSRHPVVDWIREQGIEFADLDYLYDDALDYESLYRSIADRVLTEATGGDVVYAVPGHPLVAEKSVELIIEMANTQGIEMKVVASPSFFEAVCAALNLSVGDGVQLLDGLSLKRTNLNPALPAVIFQVPDQSSASEVKLTLQQIYPDDWEITVVDAAGVEGQQRIEKIPLFQLDRRNFNYLTSLYLPPVPLERRRPSFADLVEIMARLRGEGGCPWDRQQTHQTLRRYLIEEAYEVIEAIDRIEMESLCEELGDLLLQPIFQAQLASEEGYFDIDDVIEAITVKLLNRHPHVFGDVKVESAEHVLRNWEQIKRAEKGENWRPSALDGVPKDLPALMKALEISKKAARVGFDWPDRDSVLVKLDEEVAELKEAIINDNHEAVEWEVGDLLFTIVNLARWSRIDPEDALRTMVGRFERRFRGMENDAQERGINLSDLGPEKLDELWEMVKAQEGIASSVETR
ncbi:MAG: nucleoside triphosphate pyrophosphohydrolase [Armatimonadetes bacterium]|nr:nucleoside triphosphate pyrophosphohydrolase [Armatimonadota bacterium]